MPGKALNTRLKNMKSWVSSPWDKNFKDLSSPKMQSHVIHNKMKFCSIALTLLKKPAIGVCLPTLETSWMCWWGRVEKGNRENHVSSSADSSCFSRSPRWESTEKNRRSWCKKRNTKRSCDHFLSQDSLTWQQMVCPWRIGSQKAAAPRSWF